MSIQNKKDQGNSYFKQQKYAEAIQCYKQYLKSDHKDNSKAYSNMALGCFKLKRYADCIVACQMAAQLQPEFQKVYYRMFEAYKQVKNNYGMLISGNKFCKISKDQKQIKLVQKYLIESKEQLSYNGSKYKSESDNIIQKIIKEGQVTKKDELKKQPQISKQSKWQKIVNKIKQSKQQGLNMARRFTLDECVDEQERQKYRRLLRKVKVQLKQRQRNGEEGEENDQEKNKNQGNQTDERKLSKRQEQDSQESEEEIAVEELQQYTKQKQVERKRREEAEKQKLREASEDQKRREEAEKQSKEKQEKQKHKTHQKQLEKQNQQKQQNKNQLQQSETQNNNDLPTQNTHSQTQKNSIPNSSQNEQNWEKFVTKDQAEALYLQFIDLKLQKIQDKFDGFFKCVCEVLRSTNFDKFQKAAILSTAPTKLKKFNLIIKSYTGREKQQLVQLFTENKINYVLEKYYFKK